MRHKRFAQAHQHVAGMCAAAFPTRASLEAASPSARTRNPSDRWRPEIERAVQWPLWPCGSIEHLVRVLRRVEDGWGPHPAGLAQHRQPNVVRMIARDPCHPATTVFSHVWGGVFELPSKPLPF